MLQGPRYHALPSQTENLTERPLGSLFGDNPSGRAFGQMGQIHMGKANPFGTLVAGLTADEFRLLREAFGERHCREEFGVGTLAEAVAATAAGVLGWRCRCRSRKFNSLTGTVLERCRKPLPAWVSSITLMRHNVPVECAAELCDDTHKTAFEWRHRVLATVSGYQNRIMLRDAVWVDEFCVNDTDLSKGYGQARKRGLPLPEAMHLRRHRPPQEPSRGRLRPREAQLGARE